MCVLMVMQRVTNEANLKEDPMWIRVTTEEFYDYVGVLYLMVYWNWREIDDYWSEDPRKHIPEIANVMSRNRFRDLHNGIQYVVTEVAEHLKRNFKAVWKPMDPVSSDEGIIPFTGDSIVVVKMPTKPDPVGILVYGLAGKLGYLFDFIISLGAKYLLHDIVTGFIDGLPRHGTGYCDIVDSYYGGEALLAALLLRPVRFIMSCASTRPSYLFSSTLHPGIKGGNWRYLSHNGIYAYTYCEIKTSSNKKVNFLTNCHHPSSATPATKPPVNRTYSKGNGGMDLFDKTWKSCWFPHKVMHWSAVVFLWELWACATNTHIYWKHVHNDESTFAEHLLELGSQLTTPKKRWS